MLLFLYLTLNSVLNLTNKWALSWFSFPLLLTACHMAFSFVLLLPIMLTGSMKSRLAIQLYMSLCIVFGKSVSRACLSFLRARSKWVTSMASSQLFEAPGCGFRHRETLGRQWKGLLTIGLFLGLNISLNNTALVSMTLSLNQVIRCFSPWQHQSSICS